jgi:hypothetical protein
MPAPTEVVVERDADEIAAEAYAEMDEAEKGIVTDPKKLEPTDEDGSDDGETDDNTDEQGDTGENGGEGEANEEGADEKPDDEEDKPEGKEAKSKGDTKTEDKDKAITDYAEKHKMTYAEAKEDLEKTEAILKQYKNDPAEMAKAMRNKDREYQKLRSEVDKAKEKKEPVFKRMSDDQFRDFAKKKLSEMPEYIEKYRAKFPARSESMSDEAIIEEVVEKELIIYSEKAGEKEREVKGLAEKKRTELINAIPEADRRFIPELKALILETDDEAVIMNGDTLIQDALYMVKGKAYDADIKAAEERAIKRLKESPQIIGTKGGGQSKPSGVVSAGLTERQKDAARNMFGSDYDDEKCFEMFRDTYKDELKKNSKFDPSKD